MNDPSLNDFISQLFVFPLFMVFLRMGGMMMVFPFFSDSSVSMRFRLLIALATSLMLYPILLNRLPDMPTNTGVFVTLTASELMMGILMGISARLFVATMNIAGDLISFMSGFQASTLFDPTSQANVTAPAVFLSMLGTLILLATGMHLVIIKAVVESYTSFPPGHLPPMGDVVQALLKLFADMYLIGVKLAAPVMAAGFLSYMSFGLLNRLVPQIQAFFLAQPLNIVLSIFALTMGLSLMISVFSTQLAQHVIIFTQGQAP